MSFKVEPGIYWISDPCYILSEERYEKLIESEKQDGAYIYKENNLISIALSTEHGDGEYNVLNSLYNSKVKLLSDINPLCVDSGLISITSFDLVSNIDDYDEPVGIKVKVLETIDVYTNFGILNFGSIIVDTTNTEEDVDEIDDLKNWSSWLWLN